MKKIPFNDHYGLTQAVLEGRKTQTRRVIPENLFQECRSNGLLEAGGFNSQWKEKAIDLLIAHSKYKIGEEVAVAQRYSEIKVIETMAIQQELNETFLLEKFEQSKGWSNKMFVNPKYMPHRIKITNVRVERLQDISEEDCLNEGLQWWHGIYYVNYNKETGSRMNLGNDYRKAFAALIDKTCGRGTWQSNPYVFVYDFELIK